MCLLGYNFYGPNYSCTEPPNQCFRKRFSEFPVSQNRRDGLITPITGFIQVTEDYTKNLVAGQ